MEGRYRRMSMTSVLNIRSAEHYGYKAQSNMLMEECAELIQAVNKHKRALASGEGIDEALDKLTEEIADVELMIEQIKHLLGIREITIDGFKDYKVDRTRKRMESEGKNDD